MVKILKRAYLIIMLLFIYLPILILAVYSFTSATQIGAIRGFSLQNYVTLFTTPELTDMIRGMFWEHWARSEHFIPGKGSPH